MSVYTARLFAKSNSSISLRTGQALKASINKLGVMDTGLGKPVSCSENELVRSRSPATDGSRNATVGYLDRSEARLGFLHALRSITGTSTAGAFRPQSIPSLRDCELIFVDLMAGDDFARSRALSRAKDILGCPSLGEEGSPLVIPPRSFRNIFMPKMSAMTDSYLTMIDFKLGLGTTKLMMALMPKNTNMV